RRIRALAAAVGEDAIFAEAHLAAVPLPPAPGRVIRSSIGLISLADHAESVFGIGLPFGRIHANALICFADFAKASAYGCVRTTMRRALLLCGIALGDGEKLASQIAPLGLIADANDPRLGIHACVGAPSCASASVDTRNDAARLALAIGATRDDTIHVSGC